jgi:lipopolysaccharide export LptBFGC system permease protein LptF
MSMNGGVGPETTQAADDIDFIESSLSPQVLIARQAAFFPRLLSLEDLEKLLTLDTVDKRVIIEIMNTRFSMLVINMLILARALPYFLLREPANPLVQAVKGAAMTLSLWGGGMIMLRIGGDQLNPVAAAWMPVVIYLPFSTYMLGKIRT